VKVFGLLVAAGLAGWGLASVLPVWIGLPLVAAVIALVWIKMSD
jgi:hypothetical protein